jgi:hypothetical protein
MTIFGDTEHSSGPGTGRSSLGSGDRRGLAAVRIGIGLLQGLALYLLYRAADVSDGAVLTWPATQPMVFGPLLLIASYTPVMLLAAVGRLRQRTLLIWTGVVVVTLGLLGWHDVASQVIDAASSPPFFGFPVAAFAAVALFIGHHLVVPADLERRRIAAYPTYFDTTWKAGVQLAMSLGFTGAFWNLLFLGAALFRIIGLEFLSDLLGEPWFAIPITCVAFAVAVQLTDVRDGLIRGVRTVALMLLSWLLTVFTVLVAGFLAALPFTGLTGLWATGSATSLVLVAAAALIILINTAYQDGAPDNLPPRVLRITVQVASILLTPLIAIAAWGLALRIGQHGLTPDRIIAVACALVGAVYAAGYGYAALRPMWRGKAGRVDWMAPLERTNIFAAIMTVAIILALFSPLANPARLSVADQMARLERGAVSVEDFDYAFLRFESGRGGVAALDRLAASSNPEIARRANEAKAADNVWKLRAETGPESRHDPVIAAWPEDSALPADFIEPARADDVRRQCVADASCVATLRDLNGDGQDEILMATRYFVALYARVGDGWVQQGLYRPHDCAADGAEDVRDILRSDALVSRAPAWPDLGLGDEGRVIGFNRTTECEG